MSLRGAVIASVAKQSLDCRVAYAPRNDSNEKKQHTNESNTSMTQLTILTGASRGMGLAMAEQLCTPHHTLLCISRGSSEALTTLAQKNGTTLIQWQADLAQPEAVADKLKVWLQTLNGPTFSQAVLINNAGVIGHLGPIEQATASSVQQALAINLAAPILLTQVFLQATRAWPAKRKVLQISSGLGRRAMAASAVYCATKAGLTISTEARRWMRRFHSSAPFRGGASSAPIGSPATSDHVRSRWRRRWRERRQQL